MEISTDNSMSFQIRYCTVCPTFGRSLRKHIIQSFVNVIIMCWMNLLQSFVGDMGVEVMLQEIKNLSMLIF